MALKKMKVQRKSREDIREEYEVFRIKNALVNLERHAAVDDMYSCFYAGVDPRRRKEKAAGGMVYEDRQAPANLSPEPIIRQYPRAGYDSNPYIQDSELED